MNIKSTSRGCHASAAVQIETVGGITSVPVIEKMAYDLISKWTAGSRGLKDSWITTKPKAAFE